MGLTVVVPYIVPTLSSVGATRREVAKRHRNKR